MSFDAAKITKFRISCSEKALFGFSQNKKDMENGVKQRIMDLIDIKADSVYAFAKQIGVKQTTISDYLNNGKTPSWVVLRGIIAAYPDISVEWLLRGTGDTCFIDDREAIDIPKANDTEELIEAKAAITRLSVENEALKKQIIELRAIMEYQEKRLDKMLGIMHQEPSPYVRMVAEKDNEYITNNPITL